MAKLKCRSCGTSFVGDARRRYCDAHTPPKRVRAKARSQHLRAIEPGETRTPPQKLKSIVEAAEAGSTISELRLMRVRIARTLDDPNCPPRHRNCPQSVHRKGRVMHRDDDDLADRLGDDVAEALARESAIMSATLRGPCRGCGAEASVELLGSDWDWVVVVEHRDGCRGGAL